MNRLESLLDSIEDEKRILASQNENLKAALGSASRACRDSPASAICSPAMPFSQQLPHTIARRVFAGHRAPLRRQVVILESAWKSARTQRRSRIGQGIELLRILVPPIGRPLTDGPGTTSA